MAIQFKDVSFSYTKYGVCALNKINLSINPNQEFIAIVGPTGSGKSTLVQIMNGLLLTKLGIVNIFDKIINDKTSSAFLANIRRKIGLIFQFPEYQLFESTVLKDVLFAFTTDIKNKCELKTKAIKILNKVGISSDFINTSPFNLSGGQQRKVAIAGILIMEPQIIIADEPTRGLDAQGYADIMKIFQDLYQIEQKTIICITHDMNLVAQYATRVVFMDKGNIIFDNSKEFFFKTFKLHKFNLYEPQTFRILKLMQKSFNIPFHPVYSEKEFLSYLRKFYLGGI
ncbi:MAG: ATP-binding cassette domain-containing protein [Pigeon pea little leaf phytoplasma]|uniref:ATP-binding cassette domain-containing protein n=1 Tax=Candidatus Phytoplasma fabacearum TaxID=2982628 RepID=A0ABU8ZSD6_9MOLU|nr:ATP-binding cassette domain-containing protein ['Bituminaria bituminosa' little leaf phytoplasma]MDV3148952.1 ATP-binding cassette domain-containing protein [Pigeon pea little leaf phytoplasma]MDO7983398.1 ATP-binding cassette domain-containing protein ['Bituminaria bituminosa' little leaf phytoplasma]MDO8023867.1 ATP-binding cassette domain-containing protein ['Bituminaria bituminosa' little leaf phytoplasma]MDO8030613.1 ATP-binding cassette domain-containing protein ['Bituminaria bituminos